jgi:uncharacterized protein YndB with AHSA1/START domain
MAAAGNQTANNRVGNQTTSRSAVVTLPNDTQILITRQFAAPKHLVYRTWTEPELIKRWWSGDRGDVTSIDVDLRIGGEWRYVMVVRCGTDFDGTEVAFHGEYREIVPNERIVSTEVYEGAPDGEAVNTVTFVETDGRTTLSVLVQHSCKEHRDAHVDSGMEGGLQEALDHLEQTALSLI